jgi:hypothetical protein
VFDYGGRAMSDGKDLVAIGCGNRGAQVRAWIEEGVELRSLKQAVEIEATCVPLRDFDP